MTNAVDIMRSAILVANSNHVPGCSTVEKHGKVIIVSNVSDEHHARIEPGKSIVLFGIERNHVHGPFAYATKFEVGDVAEYNSFNISYTGRITSITAKTVTIVAYQGTTSERSYRLPLQKFDFHNRHFDAEETRKSNAAWMD